MMEKKEIKSKKEIVDVNNYIQELPELTITKTITNFDFISEHISFKAKSYSLHECKKGINYLLKKKKMI